MGYVFGMWRDDDSRHTIDFFTTLLLNAPASHISFEFNRN